MRNLSKFSIQNRTFLNLQGFLLYLALKIKIKYATIKNNHNFCNTSINMMVNSTTFLARVSVSLVSEYLTGQGVGQAPGLDVLHQQTFAKVDTHLAVDQFGLVADLLLSDVVLTLLLKSRLYEYTLPQLKL